MAMFKAVATEHLKVLFFIFVLGNGFQAVPGNPANSCGIDLYRRLLTNHYLLAVAVLAAAIMFLAVRMVVNKAEAVAVARATKGNAFGAGHKAAAAAAKGIASVPAGWVRLFLRGSLLLALLLSGVASFNAIDAFEDGFLYRTGCPDGYSGSSPFGYLPKLVVCLMLIVHSFSAWVAMTQN